MSEFKLNLVQRKNVKEGETLIETKLAEVNKVWAEGNPLVWVSNIESVYRALEEAKQTDRLNDIGTYTAKYADQLLTVITAFVKDAENKAQFLKEVTQHKVGVRIVAKTEENPDVKPWVIEEGIAYMQTEPSYWGSWISSIGVDQLAQALGNEEPIHLVASKNITAASVSINKSMAAIVVDGKKIHWIYNNIYDIYKDLKTIQKSSRSELDSIGNKFEQYATQFKAILPKFLENEDNKEALLEELPNPNWYLGVRVQKDAPANEFVIENGCLYMVSQLSYFGSWVSSFNGEKLEKILTGDCNGTDVPPEYTGPQGPLGGIWSPVEKVAVVVVKEAVKMTLTQKKDVKAGDVTIADCMEKISKLMGEPFVWDNQVEDVFRGLAGKRADMLDKAGSTSATYANQFVVLFTEFSKDQDNKDQLKKEVPENKLSFRIQEKVEDGPEVPELAIEAGILYMVSTASYFGSWQSSKNSEKLCEILGAKDPMPLNTRKNIRDNLVKVNKNMEAASKVVGKPVRWQCDPQNIFDRQISDVKAKRNDLFRKIGDGLFEYSKQMLTVLTEFCKNEDNKEALVDEFSGPELVCGVKIVDSGKESVYFVKEDGILYMNAASNYYGSWLSSHSVAEFEKIF